MSYDVPSLYRRVRLELERSPRRSLSALSRELGINRHTLARIVHGQSGRTFRQLQRDTAYARACDLLANEPTKSIKEIAVLVGYGSTCTFDRFMGRLAGCTPTKLRAASHQENCTPEPMVHD